MTCDGICVGGIFVLLDGDEICDCASFCTGDGAIIDVANAILRDDEVNAAEAHKLAG